MVAMVLTIMRTYVADLPGGTATTSITIAQAGTLKELLFSFLSAAAGKIEVSLSSTSQIGTAQPTRDVLARLNCSATAGNVFAPVQVAPTKLRTLDLIYIHQTGAGNLGSVTTTL